MGHDDALALLNDLQHDFPLASRPFAAVAARHGLSQAAVVERLRGLQRGGQLSRIGAVWSAGAGGAAALCALSVPAQRLQEVALQVSRHRGVNHNYEREHAWNLWYVVTGPDERAVRDTAAAAAAEARCPALFLPMVRSYRIDLGFDMRGPHAQPRCALHAAVRAAPVAPHERALARLAEDGLPLLQRPYDAWARKLGWRAADVLHTLRRWQSAGTLRRFGAVVRHRELGYHANAMTVVQAPLGRADEIGMALATQPGVTLAYRRLTDARWPYDLYFMVHGRQRAQVEGLVAQALHAAGAAQLPHATLFSLRCFKQTGGRYFDAPAAARAIP